LRLGGVMPGGVSIVATERWQTYDFNVTNRTDTDRLGRLVLFFPGRPDVQYGRDIWVPARSRMNTWLLVGPASLPPSGPPCEVQTLLYDRTDGKERLLLPATEEKIRARGLLFRKRDESTATTAIMIDEEVEEKMIFGQLPQPETLADEAIHLARTFRLARTTLSEHISIVQPGALPATPETLDGVEHFVLASERIANDPAGLRALRHWLERGGKMWVMLDLVRPEVVAPLLGDVLDFQVVDRIRLTTTNIVAQFRGQEVPVAPPQQHERPVEFVRVLLPHQEQAEQTINGWPVRFTRSVGRGKVMFTTLGPRGWYRPRTTTEEVAAFPTFPNTPVPLLQLVQLAEELHPAKDEKAFRLEEFQAMLAEEIGYAVVSRGSVLAVFGAFLLAALALGVVLRKARRPELLGWLGPAAALGAAVAFFAVGEWSRRSAAATVSVAQVVDAVAGQEEVTARGLLAVYRPVEGPARIGVTQGGFFELDMAGIEKERRLILTDVDAWHWENLDLPAGVRLAPFRVNFPLQEPLRARARFGPGGVEGQLVAGPFQELADAILTTPNGRNLAVRLHADGKFSVQSQDVLPAQQFLASAVLNDQQQRRQELYRALLKRSSADKGQGSPMLLAWARPLDMHFALAPEARAVGSALLVMPLQWEPTPAGAHVHIPGPLIAYRRDLDGVLVRPTFEASQPTDMHLRFQLPAAVLPLTIERTKLLAKIDAPNRAITVSGQADGKHVEIHRVASPLDPLRIDIADPRLLHLDADGGLHLHVSISDRLSKEGKGEKGAVPGNEKWTIEYLELEVDGVRR